MRTYYKSTRKVNEITEEDLITALDETNGDKEEAAFLLDISVKTLERLQTKYQVKSTKYRCNN